MPVTEAPTFREIDLLLEVREACRNGRARELREDAGLSQYEVATACGVTLSTVAGWERGLRRPTGEHARLYGQLLRWLEERTG